MVDLSSVSDHRLEPLKLTNELRPNFINRWRWFLRLFLFAFAFLDFGLLAGFFYFFLWTCFVHTERYYCQEPLLVFLATVGLDCTSITDPFPGGCIGETFWLREVSLVANGDPRVPGFIFICNIYTDFGHNIYDRNGEFYLQWSTYLCRVVLFCNFGLEFQQARSSVVDGLHDMGSAKLLELFERVLINVRMV